MKTDGHRIAYFISSHGFGHATRASAVMAALREREPGLEFEIFTATPEWLFDASLASGFELHSVVTDIGLAQAGPMRTDLPLTVKRLDAFLPFDPALVASLAAEVRQAGCRLVVCDIAPLGLAVARAAGLPSVLIENFTWDWMYAEYFEEAPRLKDHAEMLHQAFVSADYHIQAEPAYPQPDANLTTRPMSRSPREAAGVTRDRLGIPREAQAVLVTMGGIPEDYGFLDQLAASSDFYFVVPGGSRHERRGRLTLLPHRSDYFHPDLVAACDAVVGKAGYSTVAEAFWANRPLGYVLRARFPEAAVIAGFIRQHMAGQEIPECEFETGAWLADLPGLLRLPRRPPSGPNGAAQAADFIGRI